MWETIKKYNDISCFFIVTFNCIPKLYESSWICHANRIIVTTYDSLALISPVSRFSFLLLPTQTPALRVSRDNFASVSCFFLKRSRKGSLQTASTASRTTVLGLSLHPRVTRTPGGRCWASILRHPFLLYKNKALPKSNCLILQQ